MTPSPIVNATILPEFEPFAKIPRLKRNCVITEKIDGTNAQIYISDDLQTIMAGSRTRWITPGKQTDNAEFAGWVEEHKEELIKLGPGRHFGEWWGLGIQRGYGLDEKIFSLFNVGRWAEGLPTPLVSLVPVLYSGIFSSEAVENALEELRQHGSKAAPGFCDPEGIIVYHAAAQSLFKVTVEKDEEFKGKAAQDNG